MEHQIPKTWVGSVAVKRLRRLAFLGNTNSAEVLRQALAQYELSQSTYIATIRDAALTLFRECIPDQQQVDSDDLPHIDFEKETREEDTEHELGELLRSAYAARGIRDAIILFLAEMGVAKPLAGTDEGNEEL